MYTNKETQKATPRNPSRMKSEEREDISMKMLLSPLNTAHKGVLKSENRKVYTTS